MKLSRLALTCALASILAGCGGNGDDPRDTGAADTAMTGGRDGSGDAAGDAPGGSDGSGTSDTADAGPPVTDATSDAGGDAGGDTGGGEVNPGARSMCPPGPFPTPAMASAQEVCTDFAFAFTYNEGPTWVASQNAFYFTNFVRMAPTQGDIIKYTPGGRCERFVAGVGCNGLAVTPDGAIVAACHQSRKVIRFDLASGKQTVVAERYMDKLLDTPNDLVVHDNGTIYFTNPQYELGGRPAGVGPGIFRIDPLGMISAIQMGNPPNGIGLSPDQRRLYVIGGGIWALDEGGVPSNRTNLFTGGDGMGVDCAGNVYASGGNIFSAQGDRIGSFPGGTNLAFGGADGKTMMLVGGGTRVRLLQMNVPGLP